MQIFPETKDPNESKVYSYDWSPRLAPRDKIASQVVVFVDAAGTTSTDTNDDTISKVRLEGGTVGGRATFAIRVTTVNEDVLEQGFGVDIADSVVGPAAPERLTVLQLRKNEAEEALHQLSLGTRVVSIERDGRKVTYQQSNKGELQAYVDSLNGQMTTIEVPRARRRPIALRYT